MRSSCWIDRADDVAPAVTSSGPLHYVGFDFHKECKNVRCLFVVFLLDRRDQRQDVVDALRSHRVAAAVDSRAHRDAEPHPTRRQVRCSRLAFFGDVLLTNVDAHSGALVSAQRGIVRVNCIDNLDRTNVVQARCGRRSRLSAPLTLCTQSVVSQFSLDRQVRRCLRRMSNVAQTTLRVSCARWAT